MKTETQLRLAIEAVCDPRTVQKVYAGEPTKRRVWERIVKAAKALGYPPPPALNSTTTKR